MNCERTFKSFKCLGNLEKSRKELFHPYSNVVWTSLEYLEGSSQNAFAFD